MVRVGRPIKNIHTYSFTFASCRVTDGTDCQLQIVQCAFSIADDIESVLGDGARTRSAVLKQRWPILPLI